MNAISSSPIVCLMYLFFYWCFILRYKCKKNYGIKTSVSVVKVGAINCLSVFISCSPNPLFITQLSTDPTNTPEKLCQPNYLCSTQKGTIPPRAVLSWGPIHGTWGYSASRGPSHCRVEQGVIKHQPAIAKDDFLTFILCVSYVTPKNHT